MDGEQRRAEVLLKAAELFAAKGYDGATLGELAESVGIRKASIYYFYQNKADLLYEILERAVLVPLERSETALKDLDTPSEKLEALIRVLVTTYDELLPFMVVGTRENRASLDDPDREQYLLKAVRDFEALWEAVVLEGIRKGEFRSTMDHKLVVFGLIGMINWMFRWHKLSAHRSYEPSEIAQTFSGLALDGLRPGRGGDGLPAEADGADA